MLNLLLKWKWTSTYSENELWALRWVWEMLDISHIVDCTAIKMLYKYTCEELGRHERFILIRCHSENTVSSSFEVLTLVKYYMHIMLNTFSCAHSYRTNTSARFHEVFSWTQPDAMQCVLSKWLIDVKIKCQKSFSL